MKKIICWIDDKLEVVIGSIFLALMVLFTFIQIVGRYVLTTPFSWTEEMTRYMFVWMVYIAVGYAVKEDKHIRITFLHSLLPKKAGKILDIFSDLVFLGFAIIVSYVGFDLMGTIRSGGQTAVSLPIPMWLLYLVMPLGFISVCVRLIQSIIKRVKSFNDVKEGEQ